MELKTITAPTTAVPDELKANIIAALMRHACRRPGIDPRNYGDRKSYMADCRTATRQLADVRTLAAAVRSHVGITGQDLLDACRPGRTSITVTADGSVSVEYCAGQYWCTEFRASAARVLATALWEWACTYARHTGHGQHGMSDGDWLRQYFRRLFGRGLASRYFT